MKMEKKKVTFFPFTVVTFFFYFLFFHLFPSGVATADTISCILYFYSGHLHVLCLTIFTSIIWSLPIPILPGSSISNIPGPTLLLLLHLNCSSDLLICNPVYPGH